MIAQFFVKHEKIIKRGLARLFDFLLVFMVMNLFFKVIEVSKLETLLKTPFYEIMIIILMPFFILGIETISLTFFGTSLGKFLLEMRLLTTTDQKLKWFLAFKRTWAVFWRFNLYYVALISPFICVKVLIKLSAKDNIPYGFDVFITLLTAFIFILTIKKIIALIIDLKVTQQTFLDKRYQTKVTYKPTSLKNWIVFVVLLMPTIIIYF